MKMEPVESSNVKAVGHDPATSTLRVEFHKGGIFDYEGVTSEKHAAFMASASKGSHLHKHIRSAHLCKKYECPLHEDAK